MEVRKKEEILRSLDANGQLNGSATTIGWSMASVVMNELSLPAAAEVTDIHIRPMAKT